MPSNQFEFDGVLIIIITLKERTANSVSTYFEKANRPEIKQLLPQKAKSIGEALEDYEKTLLPNAASFGQTVYVDDKYVGDVWCYCIDMDDAPNCMLSFCIFELEYWSKGIATSAVNMFIKNICTKYNIKTIGAFTFAHNNASIRVLEKNNFVVMEEFEEDGVLSKYLQYQC
ncbi:MAG: GNAT family N-acetyltransferase [Oscillospiraceae bacterium]|nr:GNAT family N-acetyltransferase [Oscillospiraceae bacterium]